MSWFVFNKLNTSVVGGASKLFNYALKAGIDNIVSYANLRWSNGRLYEILGFTLINRSDPNYRYYKGNNGISRIGAQKHKLSKLLGDGYNELLSEKENMKNNGWMVIYDCGNLVYNFKK